MAKHLLKQFAAFFLRHKLTRVALHDLLRLLSIIVENCVPATKYFLQPFLYWGNNVSEHFYCSKCAEYVNRTDNECSVCNTTVNLQELRKQGNFFLVASLKEQLKNMLETRNLWGCIEKFLNKPTPTSVLSDISSGKEYLNNEKIREFLAEGRNFTLSFSVDGMQTHENPKNSLWPIFCIINEINLKEKEHFVLLSTLWYGKKA